MQQKQLQKVVVFQLCLVLFAALSARAGEAARYDGPQWEFLDVKKVCAVARDVTVAKYPDCDEATVDKKMVRVYRPDGTGEAQDEAFVKLLTEKGKRANRTLTLSFMLPYFTVEIVKLEVLKPDGTAEPVDLAANSKEMIDDTQMGMNIYDPNSRVLRVNVPKLEVGDLLHSITRQTTHRSIIPGEFAEYNVIEGQGVIRHLSYDVFAPSEKTLKRVLLRDEVPGTVKYSKHDSAGGTIVHHWEVNEVPRMFEEPAMPSYENVLQRVLVSTSPDWQSISKWYWELSKPHLDVTTTDMKKSVEELTASASTDLDKVKALFYHVSKKVRYMGLTPEKDRPGFEPHDVSLTFEKKYGVCRDKAALLVSLLRMAGLNAYPVLINVGSKMDQDVPSPFFNHAIVSVELKKGEYVLMDPTDENTRELFPSYECNQTYLVCRPEGENLKLSPVEPADQNMMRITTTGTLTAPGALEAVSEISFEGINDNSYRQSFVRMKPDDLQRFFERSLKRALPGARLKSLKLSPENMLDISEPVRARIEYSVDDVIAAGNGKAVVTLPWVGKGLGLVNFVLGNTGLEKRKYPLQTSVTCGLKEALSLKLDKDFQKADSLPAGSPIEDPGITYSQTSSFAEGTLNCSRELKIKTVEFSPADYQKLRKTMETLEFDERKAPVMSCGANVAVSGALPSKRREEVVESNARILGSHKELQVTDAHTATLRAKYSKKILTYSGKVREAEFKIEYNPACQEAKLIGATVISKTGQRQEISKDEINIMDSGWNASAKRYTGGKILVANLPGVDIGSTIEVEFEVVNKGKPFLAGFESFQLPDQLDKKTFTVIAPQGFQVEKLVSGPAGVVKAEVSDAGKFVWSAENVSASPAESQLPPEFVYNPGVGYFLGDARAFYRELNQALTQRAAEAAKASALGEQLARDAKSPLEKLKAIRDFIAKSIRLAGPSFSELPLSELSSADTTLADGYGHSADRAILYSAMLKAAGFKPEFVLASSLPAIASLTNISARFPLPQHFGSPLVRVAVGDELYYLNDTDQYAQLGTTAFDGRLAVALASQEQQIIHAVRDCRDKQETSYLLTVADDGKTRVKVSRQYYGLEYNGKNRFFAELPPEERRRYYQEIVSATAQGARPVGDLVTKFDSYPGTEEFTVDIDRFTVVDNKFLYFDLPFTPALIPAGSDSRKLPLYIGGRQERLVKTEIQLPSTFRRIVVAPAAVTLTAPGDWGKAQVRSKQEGNKISIEHQFTTTPAILDPEDYPALLRLETALEKKASRLFLLQAEEARAALN